MKRFNQDADGDMIESKDGTWVRHADAAEEISRLQTFINMMKEQIAFIKSNLK